MRFLLSNTIVVLLYHTIIRITFITAGSSFLLFSTPFLAHFSNLSAGSVVRNVLKAAQEDIKFMKFMNSVHTASSGLKHVKWKVK